MKSFNQLNIGEIKALTDEQIEEYSLSVGIEELKKPEVHEHICRMIGKRVITIQREALKKIEVDLNGV